APPRSTWGIRFFFSSRGRYTSFSRDWSSGVCSSDLIELDDVGEDAVVDACGGGAWQGGDAGPQECPVDEDGPVGGDDEPAVAVGDRKSVVQGRQADDGGCANGEHQHGATIARNGPAD